MNRMTAATTTTTTQDLLRLFLMLLVVTQVTRVQEAHAQDIQRYNPCVSPEQKGPLMPPLIKWNDIPHDFRVKTNCIMPIIEELCKNNFPEVDPKKIGHDQPFDRGIPQCIGANCSIDCLHYTFCYRDLDMDMEIESVPQREIGYLPESMNFYPACNRYIEKVNKTVIKKAGRSCWDQLLCTCGLCCDSSDKRTVLAQMLERTYNDLQSHLQSQRRITRRRRPLRPSQGRLARRRIIGYRYSEG